MFYACIIVLLLCGTDKVPQKRKGEPTLSTADCCFVKQHRPGILP